MISGVCIDLSQANNLSSPSPVIASGPSVIAMEDQESIKVSFTSTLSLQFALNLCTKLQAVSRKSTTSKEICAILGMSVWANAPTVEPSSEQGMITSTNLQLTSEAGLVGCFLRMMRMKLGMAVPTTRACASPVASSSSYRSRMMRMSILKIPMDAPATLQSAEASPVNRQTTIEQVESGKMGSWTQKKFSQWYMNQQSQESLQSQACMVDAIAESFNN